MKDLRTHARIQLYDNLLFYVDFYSQCNDVLPSEYRDWFDLKLGKAPDGLEETKEGGMYHVPCASVCCEYRRGEKGTEVGIRQNQISVSARVDAENKQLFTEAKSRHNWLYVTLTYPRRVVLDSSDEDEVLPGASEDTGTLHFKLNATVHLYDVIDELICALFRYSMRFEYLNRTKLSLRAVHALACCIWIMLPKWDDNESSSAVELMLCRFVKFSSFIDGEEIYIYSYVRVK